ncbi:MAG: Crossover junction endodeoxyribonuclease RuvC [Gemmatimonadaceae bacterium]|nr:Crossover junction endodeoxyribonuclease RuvC [Gemmatimonadaceae bacterium]
MLILGVDPGTAVTGYGLVRGEPLGPYALVECGVIRTKAHEPLPARLREIYEGIRAVVTQHGPEAVAVEDVFYARNVRTTVALGHARGVVLLAAEQAGVPIHEYTPASVKKGIAGRGAATKEQVQFMVARLLRLKSAPAPSDAADGVAVALCCLMEGAQRGAARLAFDPGRPHPTAGIRRSGTIVPPPGR